MGHDHHHSHQEFEHFPMCRTRRTRLVGDCSCETTTYWLILASTLLGFTLQTALAGITGSAALKGDAWHTLFDGSDALISLVVIFFLHTTNLRESVVRRRGAILSLILLIIAIVAVAFSASKRLLSGIVYDPWLIAVGGTIGVLVGRLTLYFAGFVPPHRRTLTHHMAHAHVHMDYLISWSVVVSGVGVWVFDIPRLDGIIGLLIAGYLAHSFLPKYLGLINRS